MRAAAVNLRVPLRPRAGRQNYKSPGDTAFRVVERTKAYLRDWNQARHLDGFEVTLSIGVAEWSDGQSLDEVLDNADRQMYASKAESARAASSSS